MTFMPKITFSVYIGAEIGDCYLDFSGETVRETFEHVCTCPLEELPEWLGTPYECIAKKRLEEGR